MGKLTRRDLLRARRYAIVTEREGNHYSAYVPDLPGCLAIGLTLEETKQIIRKAIALHLTGLQQDGLPIPEPSSQVACVEVAA